MAASKTYFPRANYRFLSTDRDSPITSDSIFELDESDVWNNTIRSSSPDYRNPVPSARASKKSSAAAKSKRGAETGPTTRSLPVNITDWSKIFKVDDGDSDDDDDDVLRRDIDDDNDDDCEDSQEGGGYGGGGDRILPHEFLARQLARTRIPSFSVHEGVGRTLKGRDLSRVLVEENNKNSDIKKGNCNQSRTTVTTVKSSSQDDYAGMLADLNTSKLESLEQRQLVNFDATNKKEYRSGILVSNSKTNDMKEASKRRCVMESILSLVDSTRRISSTDFNAPENRAHLLRAHQGGPIVLTSEKKDMREGLRNEGLIEYCTAITTSLQDLFDRRAGLDLQNVVAGPTIKAPQRLPTSSLIHEPRLYGRDGDKEAIVELLLGDQSSVEKVGVVPIVGMGGVGKTTLAQMVYNDEIMDRYFEMKAWVCVSEVFDILGVTKAILESVTSEICHFKTLDQVQVQLKKALAGKRFLIVLDDVWNENYGDWTSLKSPFNDGALGSKVMVTTRERDVALMMAEIDKFYALKELSHDDSWCVFAQHAFENIGVHENPNMVSIGQKIVKKCGGLPLIVRTLGGLLRCKVREEEWEEVLTSKIWELSDEKSVILPLVEENNKNSDIKKGNCNQSRTTVTTVKSSSQDDYAGMLADLNTSKSASSSLWLIGLPDGRHIVVLDPLEQSTKNVAHATRVDQCSPTVSLLEKKLLRKTLKRKCRTMSVVFEIHQQHFGRKCEGSAKSFHATCIGKKRGTIQVSTVKRIHKQHRIHQWPYRHKWATRKWYSAGDKRSFQVSRVSMNEKLDSRLQFIHMSQCAKADESGPTVSNSEKGRLREALKCDSLTNTRSLNDLREHCGARRKDAAKGLCDSLALRSFEVLDSLPLGEQSNSIRNLARRRTLTHKHCVRLKKSQDRQQSLLSDCSGELAAQASLGLSDGGHIPSLPEKKIVRKTLKRESRTMSVLSLEDHQQYVGRRWEDDAKFLGAKRICRQLAIDRKPPEKRILRQHGTRWCQFKQSAIDLLDGGHILSLSKKKIVRKTLKRKCRNMSVLRSEYHQHVDSKWDDAVQSLGAKHIYRQLVIHRVSRAKRIRRQHGFHRWPFQQNWATLKGYFLRDERPVAVISLSIDGKLVSRLQLIHISWLGRFSPRPPALPPGGEIVGPPLALSSSQLPSTSNRAQLGGQDRSGATASHSQNERTRDQPEGRKRKIKHFTVEDLRQLCHLNREDAAKELGVSVSTLKRRRQELGIMRWPPPEEVFRPPDGNGENNPPSTSNMLSANGQITMEIGMGGPNSEPNERLPNSFEDPNFQNMGNGSIAEFENPTTFYDSHHGHDRDADFLFPDVFNGTEAAGGSGYLWEQRFESSDPIFLVYSDAAAPSQSALTIPPTMPPPQIASTQIPRENMREDRRSFLAPQEEPLPEGHVFGSVNCTIGSISDLAPSQDMPTAANTMESSEYSGYPLASVVGHRMENNHYGSSNLIDASCSNLALSQTMQPTISHMTPLPTERQDSRFVKLDAACDEDLINLYLPLMPGIMDLKQAVSVQLGLGLDRFKVKYKDGRGKWILMTHDEDVRELRRLTSSENQDSNRLEVIKVSNTTYFCRNCQCRIT